MTPEKKHKLQNIRLIVLISMLYGLLYNYLYYPHTFTEFLEAGSIGIFVGLFVGTLEEFVFAAYFRTKSFRTITVQRISLYSVLISILLALVLSIEEAALQGIKYSEAFVQYLLTYQFRRDFFFTLGFILIVLFIIELLSFVGRRHFFKLLFGRYHQPQEVERIFLFVDLKDSTTIAEKLPHVQYSELIRDYYRHLSDAILIHGGEIYQFVGDEVVVSWPMKNNKSHCIECFFKMKQIIKEHSEQYQYKYGLVPEFKAGLHGGVVIVTAVGKQKKEIVYHGDVLNTGARIQGKCNELNEELLISESTLQYLGLDKQFAVIEKGEIELKGKNQKLDLYGIRL